MPKCPGDAVRPGPATRVTVDGLAFMASGKEVEVGLASTVGAVDPAVEVVTAGLTTVMAEPPVSVGLDDPLIVPTCVAGDPEGGVADVKEGGEVGVRTEVVVGAQAVVAVESNSRLAIGSRFGGDKGRVAIHVRHVAFLP